MQMFTLAPVLFGTKSNEMFLKHAFLHIEESELCLGARNVCSFFKIVHNKFLNCKRFMNIIISLSD